MKKVRNPKIGQLVQIPYYCFAPMRTGWNGWIFRVGVIDDLYTSKTGKKCATVRYCESTAARYQLLPCKEETKNFLIEKVFQFDDLDWSQRRYREFKAIEDGGENVCWGEDTAFLLNNGFIH